MNQYLNLWALSKIGSTPQEVFWGHTKPLKGHPDAYIGVPLLFKTRAEARKAKKCWFIGMPFKVIKVKVLIQRIN